MSITLEIDGLEELENDWREACADLYSDAARAVDAALDAGEAHAKANHSYQDRTGSLTRSIKSRLTELTAERIEGVIEAGGDDVGYARVVEDGSKPHTIEPKRKRGMLAWEQPQGDWHFAKIVHHPGTAPYLFMKFAFEAAVIVLDQRLDEAVARFCSAINR